MYSSIQIRFCALTGSPNTEAMKADGISYIFEKIFIMFAGRVSGVSIYLGKDSPNMDVLLTKKPLF
jgi:hypothetical protein